jgi:hypothetical protein
LISILIVAAFAGASGGWWYVDLPRVNAVAVYRGTAVDIVYATGGVEPARWAGSRA